MDDNNLVTHGLHWLTLSTDGWQCAHPDCNWRIELRASQARAQRVFDGYHARIVRARG